MHHITVVVCFLLFKSSMPLSQPTGCNYKDGLFTCGFKTSIPLNAVGFDPRPQRLVINDVNGPITSSSFTNFAQVNTSTFDPNYASSLTFVCVAGGSAVLSLDNSSFEGMGFYQDVRIINCQFNSVPPGAFTNLGTVNLLSLEGGTIDNLDVNAFLGVNIKKDTTIPNPRGEFALSNTKLAQGGLSRGVLDPFTEASVLTLNNCRIRVIDLALFSKMKYLTRISLDNNPFTYVGNNIFSGLESLRRISMDNVPWRCSCAALWFLQFAADKGIDLQGDMMCSFPKEYDRRRITTYQTQVCGAVVACPAGLMPMSGICLTWLQILSFSITFFSFTVVVACVAFILKNRRDICKKLPSKTPVKSVNGHRAAPRRVTPYI
ncbi:leucine-rich repeat-containing protein 4C-like [Haliotis rufescens]|uniref:leucine-rich repeat-containing protein 4C-like n=1 Tax=Haliotis rufescens TaxID=6454 RepID=UPI001EAFC489|nr:leucine-rich repeat-containing protein 4C-like [Haliotis rufescens]